MSTSPESTLEPVGAVPTSVASAGAVVARSGVGLTVERVADATAREAALRVVHEVYQEEKGWLDEVAPEIPADAGARREVSWYLACRQGEPVGVVRLVYDPPLELPAEVGVELEGSVDLARLAAAGRFVEVGRLMIRPAWRSRPAVVLGLLRGAMAEVVERGYTHLLTVVFEDDPHSPLGFHTRQLGFERIGTHRQGELACTSRRILLVLDLGRAYRRLADRGSAVAAHLTRGLEQRLAGLTPSGS
jgi:N-acyl-L-homoserine lactone synthetase